MKKRLTKKLVLNKKSIARLNNDEMKSQQAGATLSCLVSCLDTVCGMYICESIPWTDCFVCEDPPTQSRPAMTCPI
jgi:hypothetical protein